MRSIIEVNKLKFGYKDLIFNNLSLKINEGSFTTIFGVNGSGKTTLAKLLLGILDNKQTILFNNLYVASRNLKVVRRNVGIVFEKVEEGFITETVMDELAFPLENLNYSNEEILKKINSIAYKLKIRGLLQKKLCDINETDKWLVSLASCLVFEPKVLIIDNGFNGLSPLKRDYVLKVLKKYNENGMTIINLTSDLCECLYGNEIIMLKKGKAVSFKSKEDFFGDETLFEKLDLELPFNISLSNKLKFYDLIHDTYFSSEELVDVLWK